jgi:sugar lactone lactonase YvrE
VTVIAPPEPPRTDLGDSRAADPLEALIEEARRRARRRRRINGAVFALATVVGLAALVAVGAVGHSGTNAATSASSSAEIPTTPDLPAGTIALTQYGGDARTILWSKHGVRDLGEGSAYGWSPDGTRLLVKRNDGLFVVRADGSGEVRLASRASTRSNFPYGHDAVWSPDGTRVAFEGEARSREEERSSYRPVYVVAADGSGLHRLAGLMVEWAFFSANLAWSPDGKHVAFAGSGDPGKEGLYLARADGRGRARRISIQADVPDPGQPAWSPDGSRIAFTSAPETTAGGLWVMNPDGSHVRRLTTWGHGPVWSPDGTKLAFANGTVWADGTHLVMFREASWDGISWSPDSRLVALVRGHGRARHGTVFVVRADGTHLVWILHTPGAGYTLPLWRNGTASTETH